MDKVAQLLKKREGILRARKNELLAQVARIDRELDTIEGAVAEHNLLIRKQEEHCTSHVAAVGAKNGAKLTKKGKHVSTTT